MQKCRGFFVLKTVKQQNGKMLPIYNILNTFLIFIPYFQKVEKMLLCCFFLVKCLIFNKLIYTAFFYFPVFYCFCCFVFLY